MDSISRASSGPKDCSLIHYEICASFSWLYIVLRFDIAHVYFSAPPLFFTQAHTAYGPCRKYIPIFYFPCLESKWAIYLRILLSFCYSRGTFCMSRTNFSLRSTSFLGLIKGSSLSPACCAKRFLPHTSFLLLAV